MVDGSIRDKILERLEGLSQSQQQEALDFISKLSGNRRLGTPGKQYMDLFGKGDPDDCDAIIRTIEESCG
jgi:hypothetical protein